MAQCAGLQRRDDGSDGDIQLRHATRNNARNAEPHEAAHILSQARPPDAKCHARAVHAPHQQGELEEARRFDNPERAARAQCEMDFLAEQLAAAVGLGGRNRRTGAGPPCRRTCV